MPLSRQVVQRALLVHGLVIVLASILVDLGAYLVMGWVLTPDELVDLGSVVQVSVMFPTLLVLVLLYGTGGPGTSVQRWLKMGPIFMQPSEFCKITLVLTLAYHFRDSGSDNHRLMKLLRMAWSALRSL